MEDFASKLVTLRKNAGLTQMQLSALSGLSQSNINTWERGRSMPLPDGLIALADALNCTIDYLLGRESEDGIITIKNEYEKSELEKINEQLDSVHKAILLGYATALLQEQRRLA